MLIRRHPVQIIQEVRGTDAQISTDYHANTKRAAPLTTFKTAKGAFKENAPLKIK